MGLRTRLGAVATELTAALGFPPRMVFQGPVDTMVPAGIAEDVVAVVREGLTNVARHAGAGSVTVTVAVADSHLSVRVADDGRGIPPGGRRSGLANLRTRAERHGGALDLREEGGTTTLCWTVPLPAATAASE
jgi:signal transduction histidine kinase